VKKRARDLIDLMWLAGKEETLDSTKMMWTSEV
jgi:hypothetical protein